MESSRIATLQPGERRKIHQTLRKIAGQHEEDETGEIAFVGRDTCVPLYTMKVIFTATPWQHRGDPFKQLRGEGKRKSARSTPGDPN